MGDPVSMSLMAASTVMGAAGSLAEGKAANAAAQNEALQLEAKGKAERAKGTREAYEERRQGRILQSDVKARMAAGGGSASDAGAIEQLGKIGAESQYNSLAALFEGDTAAESMTHAASVRRWEGAQAKKQAKQKALSTVISGASKMYGSYGGGGGASSTPLYRSNFNGMLPSSRGGA